MKILKVDSASDFFFENEIEDCILAVPTNGYIKKDGRSVCGTLILKKIVKKVPLFDYILAKKIKDNGNIFQKICYYKNIEIYSFPVKPNYGIANGNNTINNVKYKSGEKVPGWAMHPSTFMIKEFLEDCQALAHSSDKIVYVYDLSCETEYKDIAHLFDNISDNITMVFE